MVASESLELELALTDQHFKTCMDTAACRLCVGKEFRDPRLVNNVITDLTACKAETFHRILPSVLSDSRRLHDQINLSFISSGIIQSVKLTDVHLRYFLGTGKRSVENCHLHISVSESPDNGI